MFTRILALALLLSSSAFAADRTADDVKANIKRLSDHVYQEAASSSVATEKLLAAEINLQNALSLLRGEPLAPVNTMDRGDCVQWILGQRYSPSVAAFTCDAIHEAVELQCVKEVVGSHFSPTVAVDSCKGVTEQTHACFSDVLSRHFTPAVAHETCVR